MPDELNGYLVFDRSEATNVVSWGCTVKELYLDPLNTVVDDSIFYTCQTNNDYLLLPERVLAGAIGSFLLDIRGYDENDDVITSVYNLVPFRADPFPIGTLNDMYGATCEFVTKTTCNGSTSAGYLFPYAWDICTWEMISSFSTSLGTFLQVRPGTYTDANGQSANYWAYYNVSNFFTWCSNCQVNFGDIWQIPNSNYTDPAGHPISGSNVIAVRKKANSWGQNGGLRAPAWNYNTNTGYFANTGAYYSGFAQSWFMTHMNNHGEFNPTSNISITNPIVCEPALGGGGAGGYINSHSWTIKWLQDRQNKLIQLPKYDTSSMPVDPNIILSLAPIENMWSILSDLEQEAEVNIHGFTEDVDIIGPFGIGTNFSEFLSGFYVTDFFDPETRIEFLPTVWLSSEGEFQGPTGELPAGFYMLTAAFKNGEIFTRAVEAESGIDYTYDKSDMVDISVFPAPLDRNQGITFEFLSSIATNVNYELLDQYGTTCLTHTFSLTKGENTSQLTIPPSLNNGLVFHRFVFSDASVKVIESIID